MITSLRPNEIFVFGSNIEGEHLGGAARQAYDDFGAIWGIGVGFAGQTYAIPTMGGMEQIKLYVDQFKHQAVLYPEFRFLLTRIGCGIAGYTDEEIAPLFKGAPLNVIFPKEWQ